MNILRFRAWDTVNKKMISSEKIAGIDFENECIGYREKKNGKTITFFPKLNDIELMQSTGLKDKNGVEIFKGDIFIHKNNHKFVVKWDEDRFVGLDNKRNGDGYCCYISSCDKSGNSTIEVIGNIYENPELLRGDIK